MSQSALEKDYINISQTALDCKGTVIILMTISVFAGLLSGSLKQTFNLQRKMTSLEKLILLAQFYKNVLCRYHF